MEEVVFILSLQRRGMSGGSDEGRQWAGPQLVMLAVPGPRMGERGADPQCWSYCSGPLIPHKTPCGPGLWNGTAAPHTHTQAHRDTQLPQH